MVPSTGGCSRYLFIPDCHDVQDCVLSFERSVPVSTRSIPVSTRSIPVSNVRYRYRTFDTGIERSLPVSNFRYRYRTFDQHFEFVKLFLHGGAVPGIAQHLRTRQKLQFVYFQIDVFVSGAFGTPILFQLFRLPPRLPTTVAAQQDC